MIAGCAALWGCYSTSALPPELQSQVDQTVAFTQLLQAPDQSRGRVVIFGGEVLSAKRLKDGTRIEVLQLPLGDRQIPIPDRTASEGRFLAIQKEFLDPAKLPRGTRVTVVGEVTGSMTLPLDESQYTYPVLDVKNLMVWPDMDRAYRGSAYPRPYWGYPYGSPYGGRWGPWGPSPYNPYWW